VTLEEAFECGWFDLRISGIIQASLEIGLTVGRVILVESRTGFLLEQVIEEGTMNLQREVLVYI
jgi:hypothetical protein